VRGRAGLSVRRAVGKGHNLQAPASPQQSAQMAAPPNTNKSAAAAISSDHHFLPITPCHNQIFPAPPNRKNIFIYKRRGHFPPACIFIHIILYSFHFSAFYSRTRNKYCRKKRRVCHQQCAIMYICSSGGGTSVPEFSFLFLPIPLRSIFAFSAPRHYKNHCICICINVVGEWSTYATPHSSSIRLSFSLIYYGRGPAAAYTYIDESRYWSQNK